MRVLFYTAAAITAVLFSTQTVDAARIGSSAKGRNGLQ